MGDNWIGNRRGWLKNVVPDRNKDMPAPPPAATSEDLMVIYVRLRCPICKSKRVHCYKKDPDPVSGKVIRYHKCLDGGHKFKSIEEV